jgi:hypothetical protein
MKKVTITSKTDRKVFLKNVTVSYTEMSRRQKGYFGYKDVTYNYPLAVCEHGYIEFIHTSGNWSSTKKLLNAKHFHSAIGLEINEETFNKNLAKLKAVTATKLQTEKEEQTKKAAEYEQFKADLLNSLPNRIIEVAEKIKAVVTKESVQSRLEAFTTQEINEDCNRAIGFVGYEYAKNLGWMNVLRKINELIF